MADTLPDLSHLNARLSADNQRVAQWVEGLVERIDKLVDATLRSDWMEVKRLSLYIARSSALYGFPLLADGAQRLAAASEQPDAAEIKRSVIKVIGAAGQTRK